MSATVKLSFRVSKKLAPDPMKAIDWKAVNCDKTLSSQYTVNVFNRFQELPRYDSESTRLDSRNIHLTYDLMKANEEVALSTLSKKPKSQRKPVSSDSKIAEARVTLKKLSLI